MSGSPRAKPIPERLRVEAVGAPSKSRELYEEAASRIEALEFQVNALLSHCQIDECTECSQIVCSEGDPLHFHHDGCPACTE